MTDRITDRLTDRDGFLTMEYVVVIGLSLLVFSMLANLIVVQYGRGVVRVTLDEAVRAGARTTGPAAEAVRRCQRTAAQARAAYLGGGLGDGIRIRCEARGARVAATASGRFASWFPGVPDLRFADVASAPREQAP